MVTDCKGQEAKVGDTIYYSPGNKGAQPWLKSKIDKITPKSVEFQGKHGSNWCWDHPDTTLRRVSGCFVIVGSEV